MSSWLYPAEGEKAIVDGRISMFSIVPPDERPAVRAALAEKTPWAIPDRLGHGLLLYPGCPAAWLFEDWQAATRTDPDIGLPYLAHLIERYRDREDVAATRLRMIPIARLLKNGKLKISTNATTFDLWPRYPGQLTEEEQRQVEAGARAMYNLLGSQIVAPGGETEEWPKHFWRHGWSISPCDFAESRVIASPEDVEDDAEGEGPKPLSITDLHGGFVRAVDKLGSELRHLQGQIEVDLYDPPTK